MNTKKYLDASLPIEERIENLLGQMTLQEKLDQLNQQPTWSDPNPNNTGPTTGYRPTLGSIINCFDGATACNAFQKRTMTESRLGIPAIFGFDVIHGWRTVFPIPLAMSCSWNVDLIEECARRSAIEAANEGAHWTFAPMVDVPHDPRWGRVAEGYGEDPYAAGVFASAAVKGFQTDDLSSDTAISACLKHFVGYAASEGGRDYAYTDISKRTLHETYLVPFKAGVKANACTLMSAFNDICGTPAVINHYTLTEILRNRWKFDGFVVSDWASLFMLEAQGFSKDRRQRAIQSISAGNDMDMGSCMFWDLDKAVENGEIDLAIIDEAVRRVLRVKFQLGLFEKPYVTVDEHNNLGRERFEENEKRSVEIAQECILLMQNNNNLLPLSVDQYRKVAVIGPIAMDHRGLSGCWCTYLTEYDKMPLLFDQIKKLFANANVIYAPGCDYSSENTDNFAAALDAAKDADLIIMALGENDQMSGENNSRAHLGLPGVQQQLLDQIALLKKPIISLVVAGRPLVYKEIKRSSDAILHIFQGGFGCAQAICNVLSGLYNPSARTSITFPRAVGQIPIYYNMHHRARVGAGNYIDLEESPEFPFGYGLSYTTYEYSPLELSASTIRRNQSLTASVQVSNAGSRAGKETVFFYLNDPEAAITQPIKRLIGFKQVMLQPGETQCVSLTIDHSMLSYPDDEGNQILEKGLFNVAVNNGEFVSFELK